MAVTAQTSTMFSVAKCDQFEETKNLEDLLKNFCFSLNLDEFLTHNQKRNNYLSLHYKYLSLPECIYNSTCHRSFNSTYRPKRC